MEVAPSSSAPTGAATTAIQLGLREPVDGRYVSLVRSNFAHRPVKPSGEGEVCPPTREEVLHTKRDMQQRMRTSHVLPSATGSDITPNTSPSRAEVVEFAGERSGSEARDVMRQTSIYVNPVEQQRWRAEATSTSRHDFTGGRSLTESCTAADRSHRRDSNNTTHFFLGGEQSKSWQSESRANYVRAPDSFIRATKHLSDVPPLSYSDSRVQIKDTLRSHKQVDYGEVPARVASERQAREGTCGSCDRPSRGDQASVVLGYDRTDGSSLYRVSYSPIHFSRTPSPHI
jgi:hypothetical protein